jgi:hypothetical protein
MSRCSTKELDILFGMFLDRGIPLWVPMGRHGGLPLRRHRLALVDNASNAVQGVRAVHGEISAA